MNSKEFPYKIRIYGSKQDIEKDSTIIEKLLPSLTGSESKDRLVLQNAIDEQGIKVDILYAGNSVVPYKKTIAEFNKYNKSGSIENLSDYFYKFLHLCCNDIAHYNRGGYIAYYNGDFTEVKNTVINSTTVPGWRTDLQKILDEIKYK